MSATNQSHIDGFKRVSTRLGAGLVTSWALYHYLKHCWKYQPGTIKKDNKTPKPKPVIRDPASIRLWGSGSQANKLSLVYQRTLNITYQYGTAGFRGPADTLASTCLRMGMLAAIRSRTLAKDGQCPAVGIMVTASHNPEHDNGLKMIDPSGEMMKEEWEAISTEVANASEADVVGVLKRIGDDFKVDWELQPKVIVGCDTRGSSPLLLERVVQGAEAFDATVENIGVVTTPQLHWAVNKTNANEKADIDTYYSSMSEHFSWFFGKRALGHGITRKVRVEAKDEITIPPLVIDCSNGVGAKSLESLKARLQSIPGVTIPIELRNTSGRLNHQVGAEHVQKTKTVPSNVDPRNDRGKRFAAIDGDADRLVYFYTDPNSTDGKVRLLDGDKITALYSKFILDQIKEAGLDTELKIGVVQTAYANGASTQFLSKQLGIRVACTNTGVKFLHKQAQAFDIGIYFEANGHGTVLFGKRAHELIELKSKGSTAATPQQLLAADRLLAMSKLLSQCTGDAIADILVCEAILATSGMTLSDWDALYSDLPSKMLAVEVKDRSIIKTSDAERRVSSPAGLQDAIDAVISKNTDDKKRRAFVRPSGTENIVRIYAEASSQGDAEALAQEIADTVKRFC